MDRRNSVFGLKGVYVRVGAEEIQLEAAQDATMSMNAALEDLMGDDALLALDVQPKSMAIEVKGKHGKVALAALDALMGGTEASYSAGSVLGPYEENGGCTMANAITINSHVDGQLVTDTFTFVGISATQYQVIKSSDGSIVGTFDYASYPRTDVIPGVTLTVNGTVDIGSWASVTTIATNDTVEISYSTKSDFPAQVTLRVITEDIPGQGQFEFLLPKVQPGGITIPEATKSFALIDFTFRALYDPNIGKSIIIRKYDKPLISC